MKLLALLRGYFFPKPPHPRHDGRKADIIRLLMRQGFITQREIANMGDNSPSCTIHRLRRDGVLHPARCKTGYRDVVGKNGVPYRVYKWTGLVPPGFAKREECRP